MVSAFVLTLVLVALVNALASMVGAYFGGLGERFWEGARVAFGVALLVFAAILGGRGGGWVAAGPALGGLITAALGARRWRAAPPRNQPLPMGPQGVGGIVALVVGLGGAVAYAAGARWAGGALVAVGVVALGRLIYREVMAEERAFADLKAQLDDATFWPKPEADEDEGWSPYDEQRLQGRWQGASVRVAFTTLRVLVEADLPRWPEGAELVPPGRGVPLGDEELDAIAAVTGPPLATRLALGVDARRAYVELARRASVHVRDRVLHLSVPSEQVADLPALLDLAARFANRLGGVPAARGEQLDALLHRVAEEPERAVRGGHYRLLLEEEHRRGQVLLVAADDPDHELRAWAEAQDHGRDGVYR